MKDREERAKEFMEAKTKKLLQLNNSFEADLLQEVLLDQEIPAIFKPYDDMIFGSTFNEFKGWGSLWAEPKYEAKIREYLAEIRSHNEIPAASGFDDEPDEDALSQMDRSRK